VGRCRFGKSVKIRSMAMVNAQPMKAFRVMMDEEGLTLGKVAAMCGGPDWPTSVLCGLLKIPSTFREASEPERCCCCLLPAACCCAVLSTFPIWQSTSRSWGCCRSSSQSHRPRS
jgi:hypothetical protein